MSDLGDLAWSGRRVDAAPWVRSQLEQRLGGDARAVVQVMAQLTSGQLSGDSLLPDPLPLVDAVRGVGEPVWSALSDLERRAVLAVVEVGDGRADVLVALDDGVAETLQSGVLGDLMVMEPHRMTLRDPRLRAYVLARASLTERAAMDRSLAQAFHRIGDEPLARWHEIKAMVPGEECDAREVLAWAERLLAAGRATSAFRVARELAAKTSGSDASAANLLAARAVLAAGAPADAMVYLARVDHVGVLVDQARALPVWTHAVALTTGTVAEDIDSRVAAVERAATSSVDHELVRASAAHARALAASFAAMLGHEQAFWYYLPRVDAEALAHDGVGRAWLRLASVLGDDAAPLDGADLSATRTDTGSHRTLTMMADAIERVRAGDLAGAGRTLSAAVAVTSVGLHTAAWSDRSSPIATPLGSACLRLFQVVVMLWEGDVFRARAAWEDGQRMAPLATPIPGMDAALAVRMSAMVDGSLGTAVQASFPHARQRIPASVRALDLGSRAMALAIAGQHAEAAMVLEADAADERVLGFGLPPLPSVDLTGEWVMAGRGKLASRAAAASDEGPITAGQAARRARVKLWHAASSRLSSGIKAMMSLAHSGGSLWDIAYGELTAGRLQARSGSHEKALRHFIRAREMMRNLGADAWAVAIDREVGRATQANAVTTSRGPTGAPAVVSTTGEAASETPRSGEAMVAWRELLTQREWHVATLVASGRTNREIAEQLFLSTRTVEVHLGSAFRKLGVHNRVELALLAHESDR